MDYNDRLRALNEFLYKFRTDDERATIQKRMLYDLYLIDTLPHLRYAESTFHNLINEMLKIKNLKTIRVNKITIIVGLRMMKPDEVSEQIKKDIELMNERNKDYKPCKYYPNQNYYKPR